MRAATPVIGAFETIRAMAKWTYKKMSGSLHQHRRMVGINLWSAAWQRHSLIPGFSAVWTEDQPRWASIRPSGSVYADMKISKRVCVTRAPYLLESWRGVLTAERKNSDWARTLTVLGGWDGWKATEACLKSN